MNKRTTKFDELVSEKDIITKFFQLFSSDPLSAIDFAFSTNKWMKHNNDGVIHLKEKFKDLLPLIGEYYGCEVITEKNIGSHLKLISYLLRYDRQPIRFTFVFYKPNQIWQVQKLNWDTELDDEIEESAGQTRI